MLAEWLSFKCLERNLWRMLDFGVNLRKWLDRLSWRFDFKKPVPRSPCCVMLNSKNWGNCNSRHKENVNILTVQWLARRHWFEECEDFYVKRAFYKSAMSHRGYLIAFCLRKHFCLSVQSGGYTQRYTRYSQLLYGIFREYPAIPAYSHQLNFNWPVSCLPREYKVPLHLRFLGKH